MQFQAAQNFGLFFRPFCEFAASLQRRNDVRMGIPPGAALRSVDAANGRRRRGLGQEIFERFGFLSGL
jgi:hypothetical protein